MHKVDRLARSVRGLAQILEELDAVGVAFRSATEPFDTSSAAGRMMVQTLGVFAEFERATIVERTVMGLAKKASKGVDRRHPAVRLPLRHRKSSARCGSRRGPHRRRRLQALRAAASRIGRDLRVAERRGAFKPSEAVGGPRSE